MVPLAADALALLEDFARTIQDRQATAGGLMRSALGKARGLALRLSLVLEMLWWSSQQGMTPSPTQISARAFAAAALLLDAYFLPMAERVYGDAAASPRDRNAATLARWLLRERPYEVNVRSLRRETPLPGLSQSEAIYEAAHALIEADWLAKPPPGVGHRGRSAYPINPRVFEAAP